MRSAPGGKSKRRTESIRFCSRKKGARSGRGKEGKSEERGVDEESEGGSRGGRAIEDVNVRFWRLDARTSWRCAD